MVGALKCKQVGDNQFTFCFDESGLVDRLFITDPRQWQVASLEANRVVDVGIVVRQVDSCVPLVEAGLLHYGMKLTEADVHRLLDLYRIDCDRTLALKPLLKILALHVKDDPEFLKAVVQDKEEMNVVDELVEDPTFGAAFADLDPNDTHEFSDITKKLTKITHRRLGRDLRMKRKIEVKKALAATARRRVRPRLGPAAEADPPGAEAGGCGCCSPPVPGPPVAGPPVAGPPVPLKRRRRPLGRGPRRQELWDDAGHFALSEAWRLSTLTAQSAQCSLPGHERCNKTVSVRQNLNGDEARRLVMQWCIDGIGLTNREEHMKIKPVQTYTLSEIPSEQELLELVNGQTLA